MSSDKL